MHKKSNLLIAFASIMLSSFSQAMTSNTQISGTEILECTVVESYSAIPVGSKTVIDLTDSSKAIAFDLHIQTGKDIPLIKRDLEKGIMEYGYEGIVALDDLSYASPEDGGHYSELAILKLQKLGATWEVFYSYESEYLPCRECFVMRDFTHLKMECTEK